MNRKYGNVTTNKKRILRTVKSIFTLMFTSVFVFISISGYADDFSGSIADIVNAPEDMVIDNASENSDIITAEAISDDNIFVDVSDNDIQTEYTDEEALDISNNEPVSVISDVSSDDIDFADTFVEQIFTEEVGDCIITISGNLPEGLTYTIEEITDLSQYESLISASTNKNVVLQKLFDINLFYDNEIFEPEDYGTFVTVTINNLNDSDLSVYKIDEEKNIESIDSTKQDDILSFNADHFTLYGVGQTRSGGGTTTLLPGRDFNWTIRKLVDPSAGSSDSDDTITAIIFLDTPFSDGEGVVHLEESGAPVLARLNGTTVEICSEAEIIYANSDCQNMFGGGWNGSKYTYRFQKLNTLDVTWIDTSNTTNMDSMFSGCKLLTTLDVSGFNTSNVTDIQDMFYSCVSLISLDLSSWDTSNVTNMSSMFYFCESLTTLDVSGFNTVNVTSTNSMFSGCKALATLDVSSFNTSNVTNMHNMFYYCKSLTTLDVSGFDTKKVTDMSYMFDGCESLTALDISAFNTASVTDMSNMFYNCKSLTTLDVSDFNTGKVTKMDSMFYSCKLLTTLDVSGFNTEKVTKMNSMFYHCELLTTLDVSGFNTSNVTSMYSMFSGCKSLTTLDVSGFNTSNVTDMSNMFYYCKLLTTLDVSGFNTVNVTDMNSMFNFCELLTTLDVSGFNTSNVTDIHNMFYYCKSLTTLDVSGFNTSNVTKIGSMFGCCESLTALDVSDFNTTNVTDMTGLGGIIDGINGYYWPFFGCDGITEIDLSNWDLSNITNENKYPKLPINDTNIKKIITPKKIPEGQTVWLRCNSSSYSWYKDDDGDLVADSKEKYTHIPSSMLNGTSHTFIRSDIDGFSLPVVNSYLENGNSINLAIKRLTNPSLPEYSTLTTGQEVYDAINTIDNTITAVRFVDTPFTSDAEIQESGAPVYIRLNGTTVEIYSEADTIYANESMAYMFFHLTKATGIDVSWMDTSNVRNMSCLFCDCSQVETLDVSTFNTSNVESMDSMFNGCRKMTSVVGLSNFETYNATAMNGMFWDCNSLISIDLSGFETHNVINFSAMFGNCISLESLDASAIEVDSVTDLSMMFFHCQKVPELDVSCWDTPNVVNLGSVFDSCYLIEELDLSNWTTSNVTSMYSMFYDCRSLEDITFGGLFYTGNVTDMRQVFRFCSSLTDIRFDQAEWEVSSVTQTDYMFDGCSNLEYIRGLNYIKNSNDPLYESETDGIYSSLSPAHLTSAKCMFNGCVKLNVLNLEDFDFSTITSADGVANIFNDTELYVIDNLKSSGGYSISFPTGHHYKADDDRNGIPDNNSLYNISRDGKHSYIRNDLVWSDRWTITVPNEITVNTESFDIEIDCEVPLEIRWRFTNGDLEFLNGYKVSFYYDENYEIPCFIGNTAQVILYKYVEGKELVYTVFPNGLVYYDSFFDLSQSEHINTVENISEGKLTVYVKKEEISDGPAAGSETKNLEFNMEVTPVGDLLPSRYKQPLPPTI